MGMSVRDPFLDGTQIADDGIDARLDGFWAQPTSITSESVPPDWHLAIAMGSNATAVDDLSESLARKDATVSRRVLCEVRRRPSQLLGKRPVATTADAVTCRAVGSEGLRTWIVRTACRLLQTLDVREQVSDPFLYAGVRFESTEERAPDRHFARAVRGQRTAGASHERTHLFSRENAGIPLRQIARDHWVLL